MIRARVVRLRQRMQSPTGPAEIPDAELVRRAHTGDAHAEEALFRRHAGHVAAMAFRLLGDRCESEDVVQETFLAAIAQLRTRFEPISLRPWLVGIAVHKVHRRFRRRKLQALLGLFRPASDAVLETCASMETHPDIRAELALLDLALAPLADVDRAAWMLRYVEGYGLEDVARLCRCSLATAKRRIARAQQLVRAHVEIAEVDDE